MRPLHLTDVSSFKEWIFDPEVIRYSMTKFHRIKSADEVEAWFLETLKDRRCYQVGLIDPKTQELIGYAGIAGINEIDGNGEYFIFIGSKAHWGKGIASEVTKRIVDHGFRELKLHRIFLTASSSNPGAIRAYEKAGFKHEGRMREAFYRNGQYSDKVVMGILRAEYVS